MGSIQTLFTQTQIKKYLPVGLGVAAPLLYAVIGYALGVKGFPLDDAWIHQVYARNLGWQGQWAFTLGETSAGSTSPLWTLVLALGYLLRVDYYVWALVVNALLLGTLVWLAQKLELGNLVYVLALEWHLVWAAASGMETILFCVLLLAAWWCASRTPFFCGLLLGLAVWTRPEGGLLLPFCLWAQGAAATDRVHWIRRAALIGSGAALGVIPYLLFNFALSGQIFPNTFFAKQTEYAILTQAPLWQRVGQIFSAPFVGATLLLLPNLWFSKRWALLIWVSVFLFTYVWRLPVTYQHARYLIPVIPFLILASGAGAQWVQLNASYLWHRLLSRAWALGLILLTFAFWALGLNAWLTDVRVINAEMVQVALWVKTNVPPKTLVAAHDIGALGYFADVRLLDLAGLVSPEVIPFMTNEEKLWQFVHTHQADYLITYPGWCPAFTRAPELEVVYRTGEVCMPTQPNLHMLVLKRR